MLSGRRTCGHWPRLSGSGLALGGKRDGAGPPNDDATRVVPYARFAFAENTAAFLPVLEQGTRRRGIPKRLYKPNGAVYRSHHLALVCAKLGITLIHSRPYVPQGRGKIERFFRTVRMLTATRRCPDVPQALRSHTPSLCQGNRARRALPLVVEQGA